MLSILTSKKAPKIVKWYRNQIQKGMELTINDLLEFDAMRDSYYDYEIMDYFGLSRYFFNKYVFFIQFLKEKDLFYGEFQNSQET